MSRVSERKNFDQPTRIQLLEHDADETDKQVDALDDKLDEKLDSLRKSFTILMLTIAGAAIGFGLNVLLTRV